MCGTTLCVASSRVNLIKASRSKEDILGRGVGLERETSSSPADIHVDLDSGVMSFEGVEQRRSNVQCRPKLRFIFSTIALDLAASVGILN